MDRIRSQVLGKTHIEVRAMFIRKQKKLMWGGNVHESKVHGQEPDKKRVRDITNGCGSRDVVS